MFLWRRLFWGWEGLALPGVPSWLAGVFYVCGARGWSGLLWEQALHLQHSKRSSWVAVTHPLKAGETGNSNSILLAVNADLLMAIKWCPADHMLFKLCRSVLQFTHSSLAQSIPSLSSLAQLSHPITAWFWHRHDFGTHHTQKKLRSVEASDIPLLRQ